MEPRSEAVVPPTRNRTYLIIWAPWLPVALAIALAMDTARPARALSLAAIWVLLGFVLGYPVWRWYSDHDWTPDGSPISYVWHFLAAAAFAIVWTVLQYLLNPFRSRPPLEAMSLSRTVLWQVIVGGWVYATLAGLAHASRMRFRAARAESRALEARFDALRARLNPHFLFNTLHTLGALARQDADRTETAIGELGELLRYTLRDHASDLVTLGDEWEFTSRYLAFEQLRLEDRLRVRSDVSADVLRCRVPAFALQTVVENAIQHGIAPNASGGTIEISATFSDGLLKLVVQNDGAATVGGPRAGGSGLGLSSLAERLQLHFGQDAGLSAAPSGPNGYRVEMWIPVDTRPAGAT